MNQVLSFSYKFDLELYSQEQIVVKLGFLMNFLADFNAALWYFSSD